MVPPIAGKTDDGDSVYGLEDIFKTDFAANRLAWGIWFDGEAIAKAPPTHTVGVGRPGLLDIEYAQTVEVADGIAIFRDGNYTVRRVLLSLVKWIRRLVPDDDEPLFGSD